MRGRWGAGAERASAALASADVGLASPFVDGDATPDAVIWL
jgi:hypothetical protein